jgi:hypothetical protein
MRAVTVADAHTSFVDTERVACIYDCDDLQVERIRMHADSTEWVLSEIGAAPGQGWCFT